jgi:hypothetical protein
MPIYPECSHQEKHIEPFISDDGYDDSETQNTVEDSIGFSDIDHFYVYLCCPECDTILGGVTRTEVEN